MSEIREIFVDAHGHSGIIAINGDKDADVGSFGSGLTDGDLVELYDGSLWIVQKVYSHIQTGAQGSGVANYVSVDLVEAE